VRALILAFLVGVSLVPPGETEVAVAPGRFLVREVTGGWRVVTSNAAADPFVEAERLEKEFGTDVVPDVILEFASDPLFGAQWYLRNSENPGVDVGATAAWDLTTGENAVIAVIDSGLDISHPDLADRLWTNVDEVDGNGVDDDGNGFVDDRLGWDFVAGDAAPQDETGHGTLVAGVAAGAINGVGTVGLAPGARIMALRACSTSCAVSRVADAVGYAVAAGADVINLSLGGGPVGLDPLEDAVRAAGEAGVVIVAAAGNRGADLGSSPYYPAAWPYPFILSVGASDRTDELATFSNFGEVEMDLVAPGTEILGPELGGGWADDSGTSFSAPLAAATAAMVRGIRPDLDPAEVVDVLVKTADASPALTGSSVSGGRLDAGAAVEKAARITLIAQGTPTFATAPASIVFDASASTGAIADATWTIDGATYSGLSVTITVAEPRVVQASVDLTGMDGRTVSRSLTAYVGRAFADVVHSVFFEDVAWASATGVTAGCGPDQFCPDEAVTRGQAAALIRRAVGAGFSPVDAFSDDDDSEFEEDLAALAAIGVFKGCNPPTNDRVCPEDMLTRAQAAGILYRLSAPVVAPDAFSDDDGSVFEEAIDGLAQAGVVRGCNPPANDRVCPEDPITRAQLVALLHRTVG